jgi:hypothetical protein
VRTASFSPSPHRRPRGSRSSMGESRSIALFFDPSSDVARIFSGLVSLLLAIR